MSQSAGVMIGERSDDRRIEGSLAGSYLTSGTTLYMIEGGIVVISGMADTRLNKTFEVMTDAHNYASGEDIEFTTELRWCEGFTATAAAS